MFGVNNRCLVLSDFHFTRQSQTHPQILPGRGHKIHHLPRKKNFLQVKEGGESR